MTLEHFGPHEAEVLLKMTRQLYPHDRVGDIYYAEVVEALDAQGQDRRRRSSSRSRTASPRSTRPCTCRSSSCPTATRSRCCSSIEATPFFGLVRGHTVVALYNNEVLWSRLRLPGQLVAGRRLSVPRLPGRGLDAAARRRGEPAAVSGLREAGIMATTYDLTDDSVVVIVGSGAGGGTLGNELAQKGIKVVLLEAGKHESIDTFQNNEWGSFLQLSWLDKRTTSGNWRVAQPSNFPGLPAWICKTVGGTTTHWAGRVPAAPGARAQGQDHLWRDQGRQPAGLAGHAGRARALLRQGRGQDGGDPYQRHPRPARQQQFQGDVHRCQAAGLPAGQHRPHGDQQPAARRPAVLPADRLLLPGLQVLGQVVDALHRDPGRDRDRQARAAAAEPGAADPARRRRQGHRRALRRQGRQAAGAEGPRRRGSRQLDREPAPAARTRPRPSSRTGSPTARARSAGTTCGT